jgi:hypothetical protein
LRASAARWMTGRSLSLHADQYRPGEVAGVHHQAH